MNFLGHLLLTEPTRAGLLGAILGDFVKDPLTGRFDGALERAIALHRAVDSYTDRHPAVRASVARVSAGRRRYAGILVDIFFDHFLVRHWARYGTESLDDLVERTYATLLEESSRLPPRLQSLAPRMVAQDWLRSYGERDNVALTLRRVSTRLRRGEPLAGGIVELERDADALEADFHAFVPAAIAFARHWRASAPGGDLSE